MSLSARLAPLTGLAGIGCVVAGLATDQAPTSSWSDARISAWYATHGSGEWLLSAALIAAGAPFLLLFATTVADRLAAAGASARARSLVVAAGTAFAVTLITGAALYAAVPAARVFTSAPAPSPDISRYLLGAAYGALVMFSAFSAALFAGTVSAAGIRHRAMPMWLAVAGVPLAVLMLANAVLPMAAITLWFLLASVTLTVSRPRAGLATGETAVRTEPVPV
jgi:hypothetical protein